MENIKHLNSGLNIHSWNTDYYSSKPIIQFPIQLFTSNLTSQLLCLYIEYVFSFSLFLYNLIYDYFNLNN